MELFVAMQIAAYQRKRTVRHIFFGVCSENVYLCLQQRPFKWQPVPSPNRFIRLSSPVHDTKNGYDLVTQLRFHLAFCRFPLALPFFADTYLKAFFTALSPYFALFLSLLAFFLQKTPKKLIIFQPHPQLFQRPGDMKFHSLYRNIQSQSNFLVR